jgi:hypothetical protein
MLHNALNDHLFSHLYGFLIIPAYQHSFVLFDTHIMRLLAWGGMLETRARLSIHVNQAHNQAPILLINFNLAIANITMTSPYDVQDLFLFI